MPDFDKYRAMVFDFDYTLVDATEGIVKCYNGAFDDYGLPHHSVEEIRKTVGLSVEESYCILTGKNNREEGREFRLHFLKYAEEHMTKNTAFLSHAKEALESLKAKDIKTGIVSSKRAARIKEFFDRNNIKYLTPDIIIGSDSDIPLKPEPDGIIETVNFFGKYFGIEKSQVLYIGDNEVDAIAAENAGVDFLGVTTGTTSAETLAKHPHIFIADNLSVLSY